MAKVFRRQLADYLETTPAVGATPAVNSLMGAGFAALDEFPQARVERADYAAERAARASVTGYASRFAFDTQWIEGEAAIDFLYGVAREQKVGDQAETYYYRVDLYKPAVAGAYPARRFRVAVEIGGVRGAGGQTMRVTGNLHQIGEFTEGRFDTAAKTFEPT